MKNADYYKERINKSLKKFLNKKLEEDGAYSPFIKELISNLIEYNMRGGKRIRPLLTIFAYKCFKDDDRIVDASIFIELMQAYLLIHDDIMDKADLRRGKPSMHKIYSSNGNKNEHFGVSIAILAGNLLANYVYESILESDFGDEEKLEALKYIVWIINRENYGQTLDIVPGFENLKEEDVWKIYELKTATYTTQGPLYLGCVLSDAGKEKTEKLQKYALNLGLAFQVQDDINGIFGKVEETGKPNDSDIKEGKKTLLIAKTLELCDEKDKNFLLENYGKKDINDKNMVRIREIIKKSDAYNYCKNKFDELIDKARKSIIDVELKEEGKELLLFMVDYIEKLF